MSYHFYFYLNYFIERNQLNYAWACFIKNVILTHKNIFYYFTISFYNNPFITFYSFILNKNHNKRGKKKKKTQNLQQNRTIHSTARHHHTQSQPIITIKKTEGDQNKISPRQRPHWWGWTPQRGRTHDGRSQWQRPRRRKKKDREGEW